VILGRFTTFPRPALVYLHIHFLVGIWVAWNLHLKVGDSRREIRGLCVRKFRRIAEHWPCPRLPRHPSLGAADKAGAAGTIPAATDNPGVAAVRCGSSKLMRAGKGVRRREGRKTMDETVFWAIIQRCHEAAAGEMGRKCDLIKTEMIAFSKKDAQAFARHFEQATDRAYCWPLWGAAHVINGGCGDDTFSDFL
jgi:hypothetical protein